ALFRELSANLLARATRTIRYSCHLGVDLGVQHGDAFAARDLVEQDVRARGLHGVLARRLAVLLPVDADLARVEALVGEAARQALGARRHVPLDERLGHLEIRLGDQRLDERALHVALAAPLL